MTNDGREQVHWASVVMPGLFGALLGFLVTVVNLCASLIAGVLIIVIGATGMMMRRRIGKSILALGLGVLFSVLVYVMLGVLQLDYPESAAIPLLAS